MSFIAGYLLGSNDCKAEVSKALQDAGRVEYEQYVRYVATPGTYLGSDVIIIMIITSVITCIITTIFDYIRHRGYY